MATLGRWTGGTNSLIPTTSWAAPNGMFPTQARNDGSAYTWTSSTSTLTLPSSDLADGYLVIARLNYDDTSNGRVSIAGRFQQTGGTGNFVNGQAGGYSRNNNNDDSYVSCWGFIDNPSASATLQFQWQRESDAPTSGTGDKYSLDVIPLYYSNHGIYSGADNAALSGTTPNVVALNSTVNESDTAAIERASNVVTVKGDNTRYLILSSQWYNNYGESTTLRTQRVLGLDIDGAQELAAQSYAYFRQASADGVGGTPFHMLETVTANRTIELTAYLGDGVGTNQGGADLPGHTGGGEEGVQALVVLELNSSAETWLSENTATDQLDTASPRDIQISPTDGITFNDSASFTRATDIAVNVEQDMDALVFANVWAASTSITSGERGQFECNITDTGVEISDLFHGNYIRGNQGSEDTFAFASNPIGFVAVSTGDDLGVSTTNTGVDAEHATRTNVGTVGFGLINLDTLEGGANHIALPGAGSLALTGEAGPTFNWQVSQPVGALSLAGQANTRIVNHITQPAVVTLTISTDAPSLFLEIFRAPPVETLTITGQAPTLFTFMVRAPPVETLTLAGQAPTITVSEGIDKSPGEVDLTLAGQTPTITVNHIALPAAGSLTLAPQTPLRIVNSYVLPPAGSIALSTDAPSIDLSVIVPYGYLRLAPRKGLWLSGHTPTAAVSVTSPTVAPGAGSLTLTGQAGPTNDQSLAVAAGALALTGQAPSIDYLIPVPDGALTLTGQAGPTLDLGALPTEGTLALSGKAPALGIEFIVPYGFIDVYTRDGLWLCGYTPTIQIGAASRTPPAGSLTLAGQAPTAEEDHFIDVAAAALTLTGEAGPTFNWQISQPEGTLTLTGYVPDVLSTAGIIVPDGALVLDGKAGPTFNWSVSQPAGALVLDGKQPSVTGDAFITVPIVALTLAGQAPTLDNSLLVSNDDLVLSGQIPTVERDFFPVVPAGSLTFNTSALTLNYTIEVSGGTLTVTGYPVALFQVIEPPAGTLTIEGQAPTRIQSFHIDLPVPAGALVITEQLPFLSQDGVFPVGTGAITLSPKTNGTVRTVFSLKGARKHADSHSIVYELHFLTRR